LPEQWAALTVESAYPVERSPALESLAAETKAQIASTNR
jgi:hypothetical protein